MPLKHYKHALITLLDARRSEQRIPRTHTMRLVSSIRAALCLLLVVVLASDREPAAAVTLSTSSRWIVDPAGHRVKLACVNWPSHLEPVVTEGLGRQPVGAITGMVVSLGFNCVRLTYPIALATNASLSVLTVRQSLLAHGLSETVGGVEVNNPGFLDLTLIDSLKAMPETS